MRSFLRVSLLIFCISIPSVVMSDASLRSSEAVCGIENCHGLDIVCGSNVPEMCTAMYALGDFCREFARCEIVENECRLVADHRFEKCRDCMQQCEASVPSDSPSAAFDCEPRCQELFN